MADIIEIPTTKDFPSQKETVTIDGRIFILRLRWSDRFERWFLDILDESENNILMGVPLHINRDLIGRFRMTTLPQGQLIFYDTSEKIREAGRNDLGDRARLLFRPFE